jgi:tetratricopeptide (TPR) repeat protein
MSLLGRFVDPEKKKNANIDLAEVLLEIKFPSNPPAQEKLPLELSAKKHNKEINRLLAQCPTRQSVLDKVIELCGMPETPRQKYLRAIAYTLSKDDNREKAVQALELYLSGEPFEGAYRNVHHYRGNKAFTLEEEKKTHLGEMYSCLGKVYETQQSFKPAIFNYTKALELTPFDPRSYCRISAVQTKKNQTTAALNILKNAQKSPYYKPVKCKSESGDTIIDDSFKKVIDNHILDLEKKIEKGYVYTPKKK